MVFVHEEDDHVVKDKQKTKHRRHAQTCTSEKVHTTSNYQYQD